MAQHRRGWRGGCGAALLWIAAVALPASADHITPGELLQRLAPDDATFASRYVEIRESGLLTEAVRTEGELHYTSPRTLEKTERRDGDERTVFIEDDTVRIESAEETRRFPVSRSAELAALVELMEAVATGDAGRLEERFRVAIEGTEAEWRLRLQARQGEGSGRGSDGRQPLRLEVAGAEDAVERIRVDSAASGRLTLELTGAVD